MTDEGLWITWRFLMWLVCKYVYKMLTAVFLQHRIKCDQVLLSKMIVMIYLMVTTGIGIQRLGGEGE